jgi:ATP-dependent Clp protease adaptor protein ClpS
MIFNTDTQVLEEVELKEKTQKELNVVLYNDDVNSFDFVINSLIEVCDHEPLQAEQCTILVHYKGKCDVKRGSFADLRPIRNELTNRGLSATIE